MDAYEADENSDFDMEDQNTEYFTVGKKVKIDLADMDYKSWRNALKADADVLELVTGVVADITPEHNIKLQTLLEMLQQKIENPINEGNKKVLIFSAFSDTEEYLYDNVSGFVKNKYGLDTALITGAVDGRTTIKGLKATLNNVLTCFSPVSKGRDILMPGSTKEIDVLIATDCISEGQNLQDCDWLINYDIHWNPVRIIQRFGRIDRIGSKNVQIQLVNFWSDMNLDEYINLKGRVETRMKISVMTSTGDDNLINPEEKGDLEDMSTGISIMDLGLNEFRLDLLEYIKNHDGLEKKPFGLHAVAPANKEMPEGVIFVLKNSNNGVNIDSLNRIHPFYMVYIGVDGDIICDNQNPKKLLDNMRLLCRGKSEPIKELYTRFNEETDDGRDMAEMSELLSDAINSILPKMTEFNKRIPKQKFYENLNVKLAMKKFFVDQIKVIHWKNKIAATTTNLTAGKDVTELEVFQIKRNGNQMDEAVLKQIDREIPYHILFLLEYEGQYQAWIGYKEAAVSGNAAFKVNKYYHTEWLEEERMLLKLEGLDVDAVYENFVRQIAGD